MAVNMDKRVLQYITLRAEIKRQEDEFAAHIAPHKKALEQLSKILMNALNASNVESMRTIHGTVYKKEHKSASIVDKEAFWDFVVKRKLWDLVDKRANANACADYAEEHKEMPPGINYTNYITASVRKSP